MHFEILAGHPFLGILLISLFVFLIIGVLIASWWVLFEKAGLPGWKALIPIYNTYCLVLIARLPWWYFLLLFIPNLRYFLDTKIFSVIGSLLYFYLLYSVATSFGKGFWFTFFLSGAPVIFFPILAFGSAEYEGGGESTGRTTVPPHDSVLPYAAVVPTPVLKEQNIVPGSMSLSHDHPSQVS